jgi:hypothetical protein
MSTLLQGTAADVAMIQHTRYVHNAQQQLHRPVIAANSGLLFDVNHQLGGQTKSCSSSEEANAEVESRRSLFSHFIFISITDKTCQRSGM